MAGGGALWATCMAMGAGAYLSGAPRVFLQVSCSVFLNASLHP